MILVLLWYLACRLYHSEKGSFADGYRTDIRVDAYLITIEAQHALHAEVMVVAERAILLVVCRLVPHPDETIFVVKRQDKSFVRVGVRVHTRSLE